MATNKGLGRGLDALLSGGKSEKDEAMRELNVALLKPGKYQPRSHMDETSLNELAASIKAQGIMQPILVRKLADGPNAGKYEIIAGERRFRASRLAGLDSVPVLVRDVPNESAAAMALIEISIVAIHAISFFIVYPSFFYLLFLNPFSHRS